MSKIASIFVASDWQCEERLCPSLWCPLVIRISVALELSSNGLVDCLPFCLVRDGKGVSEGSEGEKEREDCEDRVCLEDTRRSSSSLLLVD